MRRPPFDEADFLTDTASSEEEGEDADLNLNMEHVQSLADLISFCIFLAFLFCVVFLDPAEYHGGKVVKGMQQGLSSAYSVNTIEKLWNFLPLLAPAVQQQHYYNGKPLNNGTTALVYDSYWMKDQNLALGRIRLRQQRLEDDNTCSVPNAFNEHFQECNSAAWVHGALLSGDAAVGTAFQERANNGSYCCLPRPFFDSKYEPHGDGYPWWSAKTKVLYPAAGFTVTLPLGEEAATAYLANLRASNYIDPKTRVLSVEYSIYNANVDHFAVARYAFEILPVGSVIPTATFDSVPLLADVRIFMNDHPKPRTVAQLIFELILYTMILGYLTRAADVATEFGSIFAYLTDPWNALDILNVITFMGIIVTRFIYVLRAANISYEVNTIGENGQEEIPNGDGVPDYDAYVRINMTVQLWRVGRNMLAIGVFINFARSFKYIRASAHLSQVTETITTALPEMGRITFVFLILFLGFTLALKIIVGTAVDGYADFIDGIFSLLGMILGKVDNLEAMFQADPVLLPILFALIVFILNFTGLTLLLSSISAAFEKVMKKNRSPDDFSRDLKLALKLLVRDTYWNVVTPVMFMFAERRLKKRNEQQRLERQKQGTVLIKSSKVHPEHTVTRSPHELKGADSSKLRDSAALTRKERKRMAKQQADTELVVQRIARVKKMLSSGQRVEEKDVHSIDVAETVSYVTHRQAILLRRIRALLEFVRDQEEALTAFDENDPIVLEQAPDPFDPAAHVDVTAAMLSGSPAYLSGRPRTEVVRLPASMVPVSGAKEATL